MGFRWTNTHQGGSMMDVDEKWYRYECAKEQLAFERAKTGWDRLHSGTPDARALLAWLEKQSDRHILESIIISILASPPELTKWEKLSSEVRAKKCERVVSLAKQLITELDDLPKPDSPLAFSFVKPLDAGFVFYSLFEKDYDCSPEVFEIQSVLKSIVEFADSVKHTKVKDSRPNTGTPEARVLAKDLAEQFLENGLPPSNTAIAYVINIAHPNIFPPPTPEQVRDWLRTAGYSA